MSQSYDSLGDGCYYYDEKPEECGQHDDERDQHPGPFKANEDCCTCGGGIRPGHELWVDGEEGTYYYDQTIGAGLKDRRANNLTLVESIIPTESDEKSCWDTDWAEEVQDKYGDSCMSWYDNNPSTCGRYDKDKFVADRMCCACGGGKETKPERKKYVCLDTDNE